MALTSPGAWSADVAGDGCDNQPLTGTIGGLLDQFDSDFGSGMAIASALMIGVGLRGAETSESRSPSSKLLADATLGS